MPPHRPAAERFAEKYVVDPDSGCWIWQAYRNPKGYGMFQPTHRENVLAYRWAWEQIHGPVPCGLVLDHFVCDNPSCANPSHVRPTTSRANTLRSDRTIASRNAAKTHCKWGHPFDEANTTFRAKGWRVCRACSSARGRVAG